MIKQSSLGPLRPLSVIAAIMVVAATVLFQLKDQEALGKWFLGAAGVAAAVWGVLLKYFFEVRSRNGKE